MERNSASKSGTARLSSISWRTSGGVPGTKTAAIPAHRDASADACQQYYIVDALAGYMGRPCVKRRRALAGKTVALIDARDAAQPGGLMSEEFVDGDRVEVQPGEGCDAGAPDVVELPWFGLRSACSVTRGAGHGNCRVKRTLGLREAGNRGLAGGAENEILAFDPGDAAQNVAGRFRHVHVVRLAVLHARARQRPQA